MRVRWDAKAILVAILFVTVVCASGQSQSDASKAPPPPATPVFKAKTDLVLIPVSVRDKSGKHIAGLKQDAFTVRQDGKEQKVAIFEEISTVAKPATRLKLPPNAFTNTLADAQQRRVVIIALDTINTDFGDQAYARRELIKYLSEQVQTDSLLCLITMSRGGVKLVHDFTRDPKLLVAALHKARGTSSQAESQGLADPLIDALQNDLIFQNEVDAIKSFVEAQSEMQRNDWRMQVLITLDALNQISQAFAGVPGKKSLLWATGSFPFQFTDPNEAQNKPQFAEILPEYERTWQLLNNANIAVYPIDARGLVNAGLPPASAHLTSRGLNSYTQTAMNKHLQSVAAMQTVAGMTGGRAFYNTNDLGAAFRRATEDSESYYLLGYYHDNTDSKPGWRQLKVAVQAEHVDVHSRTGFYVAKAPKNPDDARKQDMRLALSSPLEYTGVPMALQWLSGATSETNSPESSAKGSDKKDSNPEKKKVLFQLLLGANSIEIDSDDSNHMRFDVFGLVTDHEGKQVAQVGQTIESHLKPDGVKQMTESGLTYKNAFQVPPGDYTARVVVRDALSGHIGTIIAPLKVQ